MNYVLDLVKSLVAKEAARFIGYGSAVSIAGAIALANLFGVKLSAEEMAAVGLLGAAFVTEVIRRLVFSKATTQEKVNAATYLPAGTVVDVGSPPAGA